MFKVLEKYKDSSPEVKAAAWYTFANLMQKGINVLVVPLYTRLLTTAQYGTYSVFMSWVEIFEIIVTFRLFYGAYVVGLVKFEKDRKVYTSSLEQLSVIVTTVFLILYLILQRYVNSLTELNTQLTLMMFAMMYAIPLIGFWRAWKRVDNQYVSMAVITIVMSLLVPAFGLAGILLLDGSEQSIIFSRVVVEIIIAVILFFSNISWFTKKSELKYWKYALSMNVPLIPYYLSLVILNHSDRIVIQKLAGYSEAGIYSVAYSAAMLMTIFTSALNQSIQPWLYKELKKKNYKDIPGILVSTLLLVAVLNVVLIALAPEIISVMAPVQYHEAIWIIPPLAASVFVMFFYQNFVNVEFYYSESKMTSIASIGAALINIGLNFLLIPKFGYLAAGYTTLVSYVAFLITHYFFAKKVCKKNDCPFSIFGIRQMLLISAGFCVVCVILTIGYRFSVLRFGIILVTIAVLIIKRNDVFVFLRNLLKNRKKENL